MSNSESMRVQIIEAFKQASERRSRSLTFTFEDDAVLMESGLDSLGFAILVILLEESLGYDPFSIMDQPVYPRTFGELVGIYENNRPS